MNKKEIIDKILTRYKVNKLTEDQLLEEEIKLNKLNIKDLSQIFNKPIDADPVFSLGDKWRKMKKGSAILIQVIRTNGNMSNYVINKYTRTFNLSGKTFIIDDKAIFYNTTYKMNALLYHENIILPLKITNVNHLSYKLNLDSTTLTSVIKMEFVELLTKIAKVKDKMNAILIFVIVSAGLSLINCLILLKTSGVIQ